MKPANVQDIYPLSPMQQGLLFHHLYESASEVYFIQLGCHIRKGLNVHVFRRAWEEVIHRHAVLRTAFVWERLQKPAQVVMKRVDLPWIEEDWRGLADAEQSRKWQQFQKSDLERGFDFKQAPLMRFALLRTGEDSYYFLWSNHHIILDGWSQQIVIREVFTLYEALLQQRDAALPPPKQFRHYMEWLQKQDANKAESFWKKELQGVSAPTDMGIDQEKHPAHDGSGQFGKARFQFDRAVVQKLEELARARQITANTIVQGAWAALLAHHSGDDQVVFGATVSGRSGEVPGIESIVGVFINALPVRVKIDKSETIAAYLRRLQSKQAEAREYEYCPMLDVQKCSAVPTGTPLFEHIIGFQNFPVDTAMLQRIGTSLEIDSVDTLDINNYPLTLMVTLGTDLLVRCNYNRTRFSDAAVERMLGHLSALITQIVSHPDQKVGDLSLLGELEQQQLLQVNRTEVRYGSSYIHKLFEQQAEKTPQAIAVIYEDQMITYEQLNARATALACYLAALGVGPDVVVGICTDRSVEMVVGLLGILKAGGAYVPLDPSYPADRLQFMIRDAKMPVLLTQTHLRDNLPAMKSKVVCIDEALKLSPSTAPAPQPALSDENLAYVIYTSGSTGRPKGVMITHGCIRNHMAWMQQEFPLTAEDRILQKTAFSFDASVWEFYAPLLAGATLVVARPGGHQDPEYLLDTVQKQEITVLQLVPTQLRMLLQQPDVAQCFSLRRMYCGGEALGQDLVHDLYQHLPWVKLYNLYGPTEATIDATCGSCGEGECGLSAPIGRPIANTQVFVLNNEMAPVPAEMKGELYIGGAGLARGYLDRPELTAERFVPNPFSGESGARLYKTGDKVMLRSEDANLIYMGRLDDQVKIRGYRIELGEIESVLNALSEIRQAVVLVREDEPGEMRLVAYLVGKDIQKLNINALRNELKERLPEYMVPGALVQLQEIPLMPNGKVDRKSLPKPEVEEQHYSGRPHDEEEEILAQIFAGVLKLDRIGLEDDFFEIGGHSLLATQVISRVRNAFAIDLPLPALFESPTISGLVQHVRAARGVKRVSAPPVTSIRRDRPLPLSYAQQRLWFLDQLDPGSPAYNMTFGLRLIGNLDRSALAYSMTEVARRHETLRTCFPVKDGVPCQEIAPPSSFQPAEIDLRHLPSAEREREAQNVLAGEAARSFDLATGPLFRLHLVQMDEMEHLLILTMHHIISDGWSLRVMARDIAEYYRAYQAGEQPCLPELPVQYADFAAWQREWLSGETLEHQLNYWKKQLQGAASLDLPTDHPRSAVAAQTCGVFPCAISEGLTRKLKDLSRTESATLFMVLMAGFKVLLSWYAKSNDICVGTAIAGRTRGET